MGMDVYGNEPTHPVGSYFRASCWGWHALWNYCQSVAPKLCALVKDGHGNSGDGLSGKQARKLAAILREQFESQQIYAYARRHDSRNDERYPFAVSTAKDFMKFLEHCGGFRIT